MTKGNEAGELRAVPPRDFVRARTALATKLEGEGRVAEARQVRRLRRPNPVVWALNNAPSTAREVSALADAVGHLRRAQLGQGELRPAMERLRMAIAPIIRGASEKLRRAGLRVSPALERRLHDTLIASAADRRLRADLLAGTLTEERGAAGFDILTQGPTPAAPVRVPSAKASAPVKQGRRRRAERAARQAARRAERESRQAGRRAEREAQEAQRARRRTQREARALEAAAGRAARAAKAAAAKRDAMRAALSKQEERAAGLERAATAAREAARAAGARATPGA